MASMSEGNSSAVAGDRTATPHAVPDNNGVKYILPIAPKIFTTWGISESLHEIFNNWRNAMQKTFALESQRIHFKRSDQNGTLLIEALHPTTSHLLGFVSFNSEKGCLDVTNFDSEISQETLKINKNKEAEEQVVLGYLAAASVLTKAGFQFRIESGSRLWYLRVKDNKYLECRIKLLDESALQFRKAEFEKNVRPSTPRSAESYIFNDVSVKIGDVYWYGSKTPGGKRVHGKKISRQELNVAIKEVLFLSPTFEHMQTPYGDLILDNRYNDKIFIEGIRFKRPSHAPPFCYSYNLLKNNGLRDLADIGNSKEGARVILGIWGVALRLNPALNVPRMINLLKPGNLDFADIVHVEEFLSHEGVSYLWQWYLYAAKEKNSFYHSPEIDSRSTKIITHDLKKIPEKLPRFVWRLVRKFGFAKTPLEYQQRRAMRLPFKLDESSPFSSQYSKSVGRIFRAILALDLRTKDLKLSFRYEKDFTSWVKVNGNFITVDARFLDFIVSHENRQNTCCPLYHKRLMDETSPTHLECLHFASYFQTQVFLALKENSREGSSTDEQALRGQVTDNIKHMVYDVWAEDTGFPGEIRVAWKCSITKSSVPGRVVLHRNCSKSAKVLLAEDAIVPTNRVSKHVAACGCLQELVCLNDGHVFFEGVGIGTYLVAISHVAASAFISFASQDVQITVASTKPAQYIRSEQGTPSPSASEESFEEDVTRNLSPPFVPNQVIGKEIEATPVQSPVEKEDDNFVPRGRSHHTENGGFGRNGHHGNLVNQSVSRSPAPIPSIESQRPPSAATKQTTTSNVEQLPRVKSSSICSSHHPNVKGLTAEVPYTTERIKDLEDTLKTQLGEIQEKDIKIRGLKSENEQLYKQLKDLQNDLHQKQAKFDTQQESFDGVVEELERSEHEVQNLRERVKNPLEENRVKVDQITDLQVESRTADELKNENASLKNQLGAKEKLTQQASTFPEILAGGAEIEKEAPTTNSIESLKDQVRRLAKEKNDLTKKNDGLVNDKSNLLSVIQMMANSNGQQKRKREETSEADTTGQNDAGLPPAESANEPKRMKNAD